MTCADVSGTHRVCSALATSPVAWGPCATCRTTSVPLWRSASAKANSTAALSASGSPSASTTGSDAVCARCWPRTTVTGHTALATTGVATEPTSTSLACSLIMPTTSRSAPRAVSTSASAGLPPSSSVVTRGVAFLLVCRGQRPAEDAVRVPSARLGVGVGGHVHDPQCAAAQPGLGRRPGDRAERGRGPVGADHHLGGGGGLGALVHGGLPRVAHLCVLNGPRAAACREGPPALTPDAGRP